MACESITFHERLCLWHHGDVCYVDHNGFLCGLVKLDHHFLGHDVLLPGLLSLLFLSAFVFFSAPAKDVTKSDILLLSSTWTTRTQYQTLLFHKVIKHDVGVQTWPLLNYICQDF